MHLPRKLATIAFTSALIGGAAHADGDFALTGGIGTAGGTLEGQYRVSDNFQLRGGVNYLKFDNEVDVDDINYDGDLDFSGLGAFVDVHPFGGSFFISGGAYIGDKTFDFTATSTQSVDIGGMVFTPAEYGRLEGDTVWEDVAPFLGIGFDNTFHGSGQWGFSIVGGAALFGSGDVDLQSVGGTLSNDPILTAELQAEITEIEQEIEDYELYPILQLGLSYRF